MQVSLRRRDRRVTQKLLRKQQIPALHATDCRRPSDASRGASLPAGSPARLQSTHLNQRCTLAGFIGLRRCATNGCRRYSSAGESPTRCNLEVAYSKP